MHVNATPTENIISVLTKIIVGEPVPDFGSDEFKALLAAITVVSAPGNAHVHERIGRKVMYLLLHQHHQSCRNLLNLSCKKQFYQMISDGEK
jgi:hypothetical protein